MRMVWCRDRDSHMRLPDNRCRNNIANSTKSLTMESCKNAGPCFTTPTWKHGDWSHECGGGTRYRSAECIIPATGVKVSESRCEQHENLLHMRTAILIHVSKYCVLLYVLGCGLYRL